MIIIKTRQGDTIELKERELWGETVQNEYAFGNFCTQIRVNGYLLMPKLYLPHESILFMVLSPNPTIEGTDTRQ